MKTAASTSPGRGRGIAPFPGPHPQKQNQAVYTKVLTHPFVGYTRCYTIASIVPVSDPSRLLEPAALGSHKL